MIVGIGVDFCEVRRFARRAEQASSFFLARLLHEDEQAFYRALPGHRDKARWLACVFAAKEAALKALGTGIGGRYRPREIRTVNASGEWQLFLPASWLAPRGENVRCFLSLSCTRQSVQAVVVIEAGSGRVAEPV